MESTQTVGIARLVLYRRVRAVMLVPRDQGITLWTLRYGDEVRDPDDYFDAIKPEKPEAKLLSLALSLIKERTERWDQKMVSDPVQDNLRKIIAARKKGARKTPKADRKSTRLNSSQ